MFPEHFGEKRETNPQRNIHEVSTASSSQPEEGPSDGDRMTAELMDIIGQFMQKVSEDEDMPGYYKAAIKYK